MRTMLLRDAIVSAKKQLCSLADLELAQANQTYFRSTLLFHGISKKEINRIAKEVKKQCTSPAMDDVLLELSNLWCSDYHDEKTLAIVLASLFQQLFDGSHVRSLFKIWLEDCQSWDHVDEMCVCITGKIALRDVSLFDEFVDWSNADSMWVRRASLISHLPQIRSSFVSFAQLEKSCQILVQEPEFFIRKAIGWVLRELSEKRPNDAERIILELGNQSSGLTLREALRKFPPNRRTQILSQIKELD